ITFGKLPTQKRISTYRKVLIPGHLQIPNPTLKLHRSFPVRNIEVHPGLRVDGFCGDIQLFAGNFQRPACRNTPPVDVSGGQWRKLDIGIVQGLGMALAIDPGASEITRTVLLSYAKQHQLLATVQVQGKPVPAGLASGQGLAAPLAVEPGRARDLVHLAVETDAAVGGKKRLTVVVRCLALVGLAAVAVVALQHQRVTGRQVQVVSELRATGLELHVRQWADCAWAGGEVPVVDPGTERSGLGPGLADATAGVALGGVVPGGRGDGGVAEPDR